jgi:RNA-directed DNA polymerase
MRYAQRSTPGRTLTRLNRPTLRITQRCSLGGVISPLLLNIALQGMEAAAGVRYEDRGDRGYIKAGCPTVVTYADDCVVLCHTREQAKTVRDLLSAWLKERGLSLNQEKTRIGRINAGFDFLSLNIRRYHTGGGSKALTKPSRDALSKIRRRNALELRALPGSSPAEVIMTMNPIIKGQANYYRSGASKKAFQNLDDHLWRCMDQWARRRHPRKPWKWISTRYFGAVNPSRRNRWVFGDRDSGAYLHQYAWTKIVRHAPVPAGTHPMTLPWPATGPTGDANANPRNWPSPGNATCEPSKDSARTAGNCCCTPTAHQKHQDNGKTWYRGTRKAIAHKAITEHGNNRTTHRLVHIHCAKHQQNEQTHNPDQ